MDREKYVYSFSPGKTEGDRSMRELLGGKGANLAEMASLGLAIPPGFTISTDSCNLFYSNNSLPENITSQIKEAIRKLENNTQKKLGDPDNPLLLSVRSGARKSMPGMMETVLNIGLTSTTIPGLIKQTQNEKFVYDTYQRLISMYADVVMEKANDIEPPDGQGILQQLQEVVDQEKRQKGYKNITNFTTEELKTICQKFIDKIQQTFGKPFPDDAEEQLMQSINAVFHSWHGKRALAYRSIEKIPDDWGTAVNVQAMVFGNSGENSGSGVAFTRNPATGENVLYGEWLPNSQGEEIVAGIRTPYALNEITKTEANETFPSLENSMASVYQQLLLISKQLENHYRDMQDLEFTIENGKLWMLQTRSGKRTGTAALKIALDMLEKGIIDKKTAILRTTPTHLDELLHPILDPKVESVKRPLATGLPASPGAAAGKIVLTAEKAEELGSKGEQIILVRRETSSQDVHGMHKAQGILTTQGGMTSHAALVARGWGKACITGCKTLDIDLENSIVNINGTVFKEYDIITLNGSSGKIYGGKLPLIKVDPTHNEQLGTFLKWCDQFRSLKVRTNADQTKDISCALALGAEGIGLVRTEHMFFGERITAMQEMIMAKSKERREQALKQLLDFQKQDFREIFRLMAGLPVNVRLLDPPLHEFIPHAQELLNKLSKNLHKELAIVKKRVRELEESNPMMGHRGCRLGIVYPEITKMQSRAILEAKAELLKEDIDFELEIMVPLVGLKKELMHQKNVILQTAEEVKHKYQLDKLEFQIGTMIEIPRAALIADEIAQESQFFSFGTNDLTQMTFGFSRDDTGSFLPYYIEHNICSQDPFQSLDQKGVGALIEMAIQKGKSQRPELKIGICGEHGGDPESIAFCHKVGMDYVSCSPYRVPVVRLVAAQEQIQNPR